MMSTYLGGDSDGLDGFEFLTMAEAGEVGHWAVLDKLKEHMAEGKEQADAVVERPSRSLSSVSSRHV